MKPVVRHLSAVVSALVVALIAHAVPACAVIYSNGCAGETWRVQIHKEAYGKDRENAPGNRSSTGFHRDDSYALDVSGVYQSQLIGGKLVWISRNINWFGYSTDDVEECGITSCTSSGDIELGPDEYSYSAMTEDQQKDWLTQRKANCQENEVGNCFGYFRSKLEDAPFPEVVPRSELRYGTYSKEDGGTRTTVTLEEKGYEQMTVEANPSTIVPNQTGYLTDSLSKGGSWVGNDNEATSQLTIKLTCDGEPLKDHQVGVRIDVLPRSGGHFHIPNRPRGKLVFGKTEKDCGVETGAPLGSDDTPCITVKTDANGEAKVKFENPLVMFQYPKSPSSYDYAKYGGKSVTYAMGIAGYYTITAKSTEISAYGETITEAKAGTHIIARVDDLHQLQPSYNLTVGGGGDGHPQGAYGTAKTLQAFTDLAKAFGDYQVKHNNDLEHCPNGPKQPWKSFSDPKSNVEPLSTNDIALPEGGIFDWHISETPWRPSHQTHNKGEGGDINRFGAGGDDSGLDPTRTAIECDGSAPAIQYWYAHVLLYLGSKFGHWDCSDLGATRADPLIDCHNGEFPTYEDVPEYREDVGVVPYFPPRLHLHVED
jgi:hypothetical protein